MHWQRYVCCIIINFAEESLLEQDAHGMSLLVLLNHRKADSPLKKDDIEAFLKKFNEKHNNLVQDVMIETINAISGYGDNFFV